MEIQFKIQYKQININKAKIRYNNKIKKKTCLKSEQIFKIF